VSDEPIHAWQWAFRGGLAPQLTLRQLEALAGALEGNDPRLVQGATVSPPPVSGCEDMDAELACPVGFCGLAEGLKTVSEVNEYFAKACEEMDRLLGHPADCAWFLRWVDDTPRAEMRPLLLAEVRAELARRGAA
jgi:hypothetical protein